MVRTRCTGHGDGSLNRNPCNGSRFILWMDDILQHIRFPGMMIPMQIPTNSGFPRFQSDAGFCPSSMTTRNNPGPKLSGPLTMAHMGAICSLGPSGGNDLHGDLCPRGVPIEIHGHVVAPQNRTPVKCPEDGWFHFGFPSKSERGGFSTLSGSHYLLSSADWPKQVTQTAPLHPFPRLS